MILIKYYKLRVDLFLFFAKKRNWIVLTKIKRKFPNSITKYGKYHNIYAKICKKYDVVPDVNLESSKPTSTKKLWLQCILTVYDHVCAIYAEKNPEKLADVTKILKIGFEKYGNFRDIYLKICSKYNVNCVRSKRK